DGENVGKLQPKADIGIFIGYAPTKKAFRIYNRRTRHAKVIAPIAEVIPQVADDSTGSPSSTTVDQDAPSSSKSLTPTEIQSPVILQDVGNDNLDIKVAHIGNDPLPSVPITEVASRQSSSTASPQTNVQPNHPMTYLNSKWTKDHPLNYIIGPLSRPVFTRLQLHEQALFCYYDSFLTSVEPKTYKEALTQACWIEAMQEELHEFKRLEVWVKDIVSKVLIVGYEHVVMNCGSAGNSMSKALLIPKYQYYQTQHVLITGTSQSKQHDKSEPVSYYLTD
nr:hypothetical protein [Tanacetum cinerariifolium]